MSKKKGLGALLAFSAFAGAAAGTVAYLYKYRKFSEAVDRDFTDVMDSVSEVKDSAKRSYTTLKSSISKEDLKAVAKDLGYAARNLAVDTKNLAVDAGKDAYRAVKEGLDSRFKSEELKPDCFDDEEPEIEVEFYNAEDTVNPESGIPCDVPDKSIEEAIAEEVEGLEEEAKA